MDNSYPVKVYGQAARRYCRTLELRNTDPKFIDEYCYRHSKGVIWQEIPEGIRAVGILGMDIFILGTRLVMIMDVVDDFNWDEAMSRLATLPRQQEWEDYMSTFQEADKGLSPAEKWQTMRRMFSLDQ